MRSDECVEAPVHATAASQRPPPEHGKQSFAGAMLPKRHSTWPRLRRKGSSLDTGACDKAVTA